MACGRGIPGDAAGVLDRQGAPVGDTAAGTVSGGSSES
jgi:hypothetical protein